VLAWANAVLQTNQNRRAIVVSHYLLNSGFNARFSAQGQSVYNALRGNTNLFLMLCGHMTPPEGQRTSTFNGRTVWTVMSDYQDSGNGGNGWLRLYEFSPAQNVIHVKTYSPWLNQVETDADSQFDIPYAMTSTNAFSILGIRSNVLSGASAVSTWTNLVPGTKYEWYVTVADGENTTTGTIMNFTVGTNAPLAPLLSAGPGILPDGRFHAGFTASVGAPYTVYWASNVIGPWQPLTNLVPDTNGLIHLEDNADPKPPARFYRLAHP
jgi:hypothetical protein